MVKSEEKIRVVIYARFSSNHQREESIDAQLRACKEYAERQGYVVVGTYCDSAKSGRSTENRDQFLKMIADSEEKMFDMLIVHKLDRFSRDRYDAVIFKRRLRSNGVRVVSVTENLSDTPESQILEAVLEGMSEYYSANLSREVMKGMKENAYKCKHNGGKSPLGYDVAPDLTYVINEQEAEIVQKIFTMYTNHCGYAEILEELNTLGYRTKNGNKFGKNSINSILKNEKYRGVYVFNRKKKLTYDKKRNAKDKPPEEVVRVEGGMPRVVSDDMFYKAMHLMTKNKLRGASYNAKTSYLLSGVIYCSKCGRAMCGNGRIGGKTDKKYYSYRCSSKTNKKADTCDCKEVRKEFVENYVLDELSELLFNESTINELVTKMNAYSSEKQESDKNELKVLRSKLKELEKELTNTLKLVTNGNVAFDTVKATVDQLEGNKEYIQSKIDEFEAFLKVDFVTVEKLEALIKESKSFILEKNIPECRKFIDSYIDNVSVSNEGVNVVFNINMVDEETNELVKYETAIEKDDLYQQYKYVLNQSA